MPLPFYPDDIPINEKHQIRPTEIYYLKGAIHFKKTARIYDITRSVRTPFDDFSNEFLSSVQRAVKKQEDDESRPAAFEIGSCGEMMRTIKTMSDGASGERVADLNITFVSFDSSTVRFPPGSEHCSREVEVAPVEDAKGRKYECFVKNSIPYFWDMNGQQGILYKTWNQHRVEIGRVVGYGFGKDAVLVLDGKALDNVVALSTCVILLNGRDAMDS